MEKAVFMSLNIVICIWLSAAMTAFWIIACGSRVSAMWYSCINTESALSAADVKVLLTSSIFLPVPSRPPCCSAPRCVQLWRVKSVKTLAPPGHQHPDSCVYESQPQCQHHDQNMHHAAASRIPAKQCYWSAVRQHRLENKSTIACLVTLMVSIFWLHILDLAKMLNRPHTDWSYESCNMILFDWMHQVQIGFPLTPRSLPASTSTDER